MKKTRLLGASIAPFALMFVALTSTAEAPYRGPVQFALENIISGNAATAVVAGIAVKVMPTRTWKSVSGHYCRRYVITVTEPGADPVHGERTRCRVKGGWWTLVKEN